MALLSAAFFGSREIVTQDDLAKHVVHDQRELALIQSEIRERDATIWRELESRERLAYRRPDADRDAAIFKLSIEHLIDRIEKLEGKHD